MRIIALGQQKGGVGKSSAVINLAAQAVAAGHKAAIIDMDIEQGTAMKWGKRRNGAEAPIVVDADSISIDEVLAQLKEQGVEWVFIDLPGRSAGTSGAGMKAADLVLVPCRPLDVDVEAAITTIQAVTRGGKRYSFLMNIAPPQVNAQRARKVAKVLSDAGHAVSPVIIIQRIQVPDAIAVGKSVDELDPECASAEEFRDLFDWIRQEVKS